MRILAIDYGTKKCGIAISDKNQRIAIPYGLVETKQLLEKLKSLIINKSITKIVIGLPLSLSGKEIEITKKVYELKEEIEKEFKIEVILFDERMTSKIFSNELLYKKFDDLSASILLNDYLLYLKNTKK